MGEEKVISNTFERHAQTALVLLLVALLLWVGSTTQHTSLSVAEMRIEIAYLKAASEKPHEHKDLVQSVKELKDRLVILENQRKEYAR